MVASMRRGWLWVVMVLAGLHGPAMGAPVGPTEQVRAAVDAVLDTLRDGGVEGEARRARIRSLIAGSFDFRAMAQGVLATHWRRASPAEREEFVELFSRLLEASYMGRIEQYTDERVEYLGETISNERAQVETRIVTRSVEIPVRYKLIQGPAGWRIYDVVIEEVSLIRNYRSSYGEIARQEGIAGLLARMQERLKAMVEEPPPGPRS